MKNRTKMILVLAMAVVLLTAAVGGTLAYLATKSGPVVNTFEPARVTCKVSESFDGSKKSNVQIVNTGTTSAYIRAAVVANWCDANGNIIAPQTVDLTGKMGTGWSQGDDGYYYYNSPVAAGDPTSNLINSYTPVRPEGVPAGSHLVMDIVCQAIQSEGGAVKVDNGWTISK